MKSLVKVQNISHAVTCIFEENLLAEFEEKIAVINDGENFETVIKRNNISLETLINFLNDHSSDKYIKL